jgi:hypothetical protein
MSTELPEWVILYRARLGVSWLPQCVSVRAQTSSLAVERGKLEVARLLDRWTADTGIPHEVDPTSFAAELAEDFWTTERQNRLTVVTKARHG